MSKQNPEKELEGLFEDFKKEGNPEESVRIKLEPENLKKPKEEPKVKVKTQDGTGMPMPLTDIQRYNKILQKKENASNIWKAVWTVMFLSLVYYVIANNVFNNVIAICGHCVK